MFQFSLIKRFVLPFLLFVLVGCLIMIHQYSTLNPRPLNLPDPIIKLSKNCLQERRTTQLEKPELIKVPLLSTNSITTDEFLNKSSRIRHVFFPENRNPIHPRKGNHDYYYPGRRWFDTKGNPIQAHGGGILFDKRLNTYYWYGENKDGPTYPAPAGKNVARVDIIGVSCYSSKDLRTWKNEGVILKAQVKDKSHDLYKSNVLERPKVIYNDRTKKYVMWMHIDDSNYTKAAVGVAVSYSPTGPFEYLYSKSPNGFDSRDMTVYKDEDDGMAYLIYSSVHNRELHITPLDQDYLDVGPTMAKALVGQHREAPAVFKDRGKYYMITSACSGWAPNEAMAHVANSVMGPWVSIGNPCVGSIEFRVATFFAQSTFVLPMPGGIPGLFVFMADRWKPDDLRDSRYVWLPLTVEQEEEEKEGYGLSRPKVSIFWHGKWKIPKN